MFTFPNVRPENYVEKSYLMYQEGDHVKRKEKETMGIEHFILISIGLIAAVLYADKKVDDAEEVVQEYKQKFKNGFEK